MNRLKSVSGSLCYRQFKNGQKTWEIHSEYRTLRKPAGEYCASRWYVLIAQSLVFNTYTTLPFLYCNMVILKKEFLKILHGSQFLAILLLLRKLENLYFFCVSVYT